MSGSGRDGWRSGEGHGLRRPAPVRIHRSGFVDRIRDSCSGGDEPVGQGLPAGRVRAVPRPGLLHPDRRFSAGEQTPGHRDVEHHRGPQEHPIALGDLVPLAVGELPAEFAGRGRHQQERKPKRKTEAEAPPKPFRGK